MKIKKKQQMAKRWFLELQKLICKNIEELEKIYGSNKKFKKNKFDSKKAKTIFGYSILYLFLIFVLFLIDKIL